DGGTARVDGRDVLRVGVAEEDVTPVADEPGPDRPADRARSDDDVVHGPILARMRVSLVAPPVRDHLGVAGVVSGAEREVLDALGSRLACPHRVLLESDRVPAAELD